MRLKRTAFILIFALCGHAAFAADLLQTYKKALLNDAQYMAARATVQAAREKGSQGLAVLLPGISASASKSRDYESDADTTVLSLTLRQPLFRAQEFVMYGQAKLQVKQAEAVFAQSKEDLIIRVAEVYFDALYAVETLHAARASKKAIDKQLQQVKKNFELGLATITDTYEAQSRYDLVSAQELAAENDLQVKLFALRAIVGENLGPVNRLPPKIELQGPQPDDIEKWVNAAVVRNYRVQAQEALTQIAEKEVWRMRAGRLPTVDFFVEQTDRDTSATTMGGTPQANSKTLGVQVAFPIFQGGLVSSLTSEAIAKRDAARAALDHARRQAALAARQAFLGLASGTKQVQALEAALVSSESALESNKEGYKAGVRINIDVLNAEQQVLQTKRELARARFDALLAQLKLKSAVGSLSEDDVVRINSIFAAN